ncbi:MAG: tetratricopeptide repeat protein [Terracidiphilus sp.]
MSKEHKRFNLQLYLRREPVTLALLTGLAIVLFAAVTGISHLYQAQQESLADRWSARGAGDLQAQRYGAAVTDFRTSLLYSRDNFNYQLNLALALVGEKRLDEANTYLLNLWDSQPENGMVNLELGRIAAARGQTDSAIRYYHNAIYSVWPGDQDSERYNTRLELIELELKINAKPLAESELIAMAANLGDDPAEHAEAGELFFDAQDYQRALEQFRLVLKSNRHDAAAITGAGEAAFKLNQYAMAERYLQEAVTAGDKADELHLKTAQLVIEMDPFRPQISTADRDRIVVEDFTAADARLQSCGAPGTLSAVPTTLQSLTQDWTKLKPQIVAWRLRRDPDLVNTAMQLVFNIERETGGMCGSPTDADNALLLVSNLHGGQ